MDIGHIWSGPVQEFLIAGLQQTPVSVLWFLKFPRQIIHKKNNKKLYDGEIESIHGLVMKI